MACIVLVPLVIGLVYAGQYIHLKQTIQQAAREAAWDAAVAPSTYKKDNPDTAVEETRLQARYFAKAGDTVNTSASAPGSFHDPLLLDYSGRTLLKPDKLTLEVYSNNSTPGFEGKLTKWAGDVSNFISKVPGVVGGHFPPDNNGYLLAKVNADTEKAKYFKPLDSLDLHFHAQTALLADAWNADGPGLKDNEKSYEDIYSKSPIPDRTVVMALPPSAAMMGNSVLQGITGALNKVEDIPILGDLMKMFFPLQGLEFGKAAIDVVPYDKLQPYEK